VDAVVVGAGIAGLLAARQLHAAGWDVVVYEAAPAVGGRLATEDLGPARADSGAQFFTARGERFTVLVEELVATGVVHEWCRGFGPEPDGFPRYACRDGMAALAGHLARGLDVRTDRAVGRVQDAADGADAVVLAVPVPLAVRILRASAIEPPESLVGMTYVSTTAFVVGLDRPPVLAAPGGLQEPEGPFSFIGDNVAKGASSQPAVTFHLPGAPQPVAAMLAAARPYLGDAEVLHTRTRWWPHAGPVTVHPDPCVEVRPGLVLAGDAYAGPKVEGAATSGWAAADRLLG
jgi:predicted NAD/FAD-dependent oxidoreductase